MKVAWLLGLLVAVATCVGCLSGDGDGDAAPGDGGAPGEPEVRIGTSDEALAFHPLEDGDDVPLETFGQGGTHASIAVRCIGLGDRAFVDVTLENLESGAMVMTPPSSRPPLLLCREDPEVCDLVPLYVMTGGLAEPDEKDGLRIRITAEARSLEGETVSTSREAVLRQAF